MAETLTVTYTRQPLEIITSMLLTELITNVSDLGPWKTMTLKALDGEKEEIVDPSDPPEPTPTTKPFNDHSLTVDILLFNNLTHVVYKLAFESNARFRRQTTFIRAYNTFLWTLMIYLPRFNGVDKSLVLSLTPKLGINRTMLMGQIYRPVQNSYNTVKVQVHEICEELKTKKATPWTATTAKKLVHDPQYAILVV